MKTMKLVFFITILMGLALSKPSMVKSQVSDKTKQNILKHLRDANLNIGSAKAFKTVKQSLDSII